jgi:hypothetical protein
VAGLLRERSHECWKGGRTCPILMPSSFAPVYSSSMHSMDDRKNALNVHAGERLQTPLHSGSAVLRRALRRNIVSFPSQIPVFLKQPPADMQWRMVLLYFIRGWSSVKIAARFNVPTHWIRKSLNEWSVRALALGFVQVIDPEAFAACCHSDVEFETNRNTEESDSQPFPEAVPAVCAAFPKAPEATRLEILPVNSLDKSADLIAALDASIAHCGEWHDEFWVRTATLLRDLRAVAAAMEVQRSGQPADGLFAAREDDNGGIHGLRVCEEERVSHAVA